MSDLYRLRVRDDATGFVAPWAGQTVGDPMPLSEAEELRRAMPNGGQMEAVPAPEGSEL